MKCRVHVGLVVVALMMFTSGSAPAQSETPEIVGGTFLRNRPFRTGVNLTLRVTHTSSKSFDALVGPLPDAGLGSSTLFAAYDVGTVATNRIELVLLEDGFIYMTGVQPYGGTDGGSTGSQGTILVVQRETLDGVVHHRFFRLNATPAEQPVTVDGVHPPSEKTITANFSYVEKTTGSDLEDPKAVPNINDPDPANKRIARFVEAVIDAADDAGLQKP